MRFSLAYCVVLAASATAAGAYGVCRSAAPAPANFNATGDSTAADLITYADGLKMGAASKPARKTSLKFQPCAGMTEQMLVQGLGQPCRVEAAGQRLVFDAGTAVMREGTMMGWIVPDAQLMQHAASKIAISEAFAPKHSKPAASTKPASKHLRVAGSQTSSARTNHAGSKAVTAPGVFVTPLSLSPNRFAKPDWLRAWSQARDVQRQQANFKQQFGRRGNSNYGADRVISKTRRH